MPVRYREDVCSALAGRRYRRTPAVRSFVTTRPPPRISSSPRSAILTAMSRTDGISVRQVAPPTVRATSLGQIDRLGCRLRSRVRAAASTRFVVAVGVGGSHQCVTTLAQRDFRIIHAPTGASKCRRCSGVAHGTTSRHQLVDQFLAQCGRDVWIRRPPPAPVDDDERGPGRLGARAVSSSSRMRLTAHSALEEVHECRLLARLEGFSRRVRPTTGSLLPT